MLKKYQRGCCRQTVVKTGQAAPQVEMDMRTRDLDKQQRIKEAMVRLILTEGMSGASVARIAREASVSPATIYVYYSSKEEMMAEVFKEYTHQSYRYLRRQLEPRMTAGQLVEALVRGCYAYTMEYPEAFSFVEQCSRCPTLSAAVCDEECCCDIFGLIHEYQSRGLMRRCSDANLSAVLFAPVRFIAGRSGQMGQEEMNAQLSELVSLLQGMLVL